MDDNAIIQLFWSRSEDAVAMTQQKYGQLLRHIAMNILGDRWDAQEAEFDAYLRLWNSIPPEHPRCFRAYAAKLCRNCALNILKKKRCKKRDHRADVLLSELDECVPVSEGPESILEERELARLINEYLETLDQTSRSLFLRRYFSMDPLDELASDFGMTKHAVSTRLYRVRQGLKNYLEKEGIAI